MDLATTQAIVAAALMGGVFLGTVATELWGEAAGFAVGMTAAAALELWLYETYAAWYDRNKQREA